MRFARRFLLTLCFTFLLACVAPRLGPAPQDIGEPRSFGAVETRNIGGVPPRDQQQFERPDGPERNHRRERIVRQDHALAAPLFDGQVVAQQAMAGAGKIFGHLAAIAQVIGKAEGGDQQRNDAVAQGDDQSLWTECRSLWPKHTPYYADAGDAVMPGSIEKAHAALARRPTSTERRPTQGLRREAGVRPSSAGLSMFAPRANRSWMEASSAFWQAEWSAVKPPCWVASARIPASRSLSRIAAR